MSDTISDDCFYSACDNCEWAACACDCHDEQQFSHWYGWQDLDDWYVDDVEPSPVGTS